MANSRVTVCRVLSHDEMRTELMDLIRLVNGSILPRRGFVTLAADHQSCLHYEELGPTTVAGSILVKLFYGNSKVADWKELFIGMLACYSLWLDAESFGMSLVGANDVPVDIGTFEVLSPLDIYRGLNELRHGRVPSSNELVKHMVHFVQHLRPVVLTAAVGSWKDDEVVQKAAEYMRKYGASCVRCSSKRSRDVR